MQTLARYSLEKILPIIGLGKPPLLLSGYQVKASSSRLECLKRNQTCVECGKVGNIFLLQSTYSPKSYLNCFLGDNCSFCLKGEESNHEWDNFYDDPDLHLNLYHIGQTGRLLLMTQDHILPQWVGGKDHQDNLQTMCRGCLVWRKKK